jgi:hypothetical protein
MPTCTEETITTVILGDICGRIVGNSPLAKPKFNRRQHSEQGVDCVTASSRAAVDYLLIVFPEQAYLSTPAS